VKNFFLHACADPQPTALDKLKTANELTIKWNDSTQKSNVNINYRRRLCSNANTSTVASAC